MNKQHKSILSIILLIAFFVLQIVVFWMYTPCKTYSELLEKNWLVYKLDKISWFMLVSAGFINSEGSNRAFWRVIFIAVLYSTLNELTGLNNYLYAFEYPVFWLLIVSTSIFSFLKYKSR